MAFLGCSRSSARSALGCPLKQNLARVRISFGGEQMQQKRSIINYFDIDLLLIFGELEPHTQKPISNFECVKTQGKAGADLDEF